MADEVPSHHKSQRRKVVRRFCGGLLVLNVILLAIFLLLCGILQPKKPLFMLQNVTVFTFSVTNFSDMMSTAVNATINSTNPNSKIGIYYEKLNVYATYSNQRITNYTVIPPLYEAQKAQNVWSPSISGGMVQVKDLYGLYQDRYDGEFSITVKIDGRIKWKVASFVSGRHHIHVSCPAYIPLGNSKATGVVVGAGVKYQLWQSCSVIV